MRLNNRLDTFYNTYILVHEFDYNSWFTTNGEEIDPNDFLDPYKYNVNTYNPDKINPKTGLIEGCFKVIERQEWIIEGFFGEKYDNLFLVDIGSTKVLLTSGAYYSPLIEEVYEASEQTKKEDPKEEKKYEILEEQEIGQINQNSFTQANTMPKIKELHPHQIIIEEAKRKQQERKERKLKEQEEMKAKAKDFTIPFDILHPNEFLEKSIKLEFFNDIYWDIWITNVKLKNKDTMYKQWCNQKNKKLNNLNPLEYAYLKVRDENVSQEEALKELKEFVKKELGL